MLNNREGKISLTTMEYSCECGKTFEISTNDKGNDLCFCPYCGIDRHKKENSLKFNENHCYEISDQKF